MYLVGWPLWKLAARVGIPLVVKIDVIHDEETGVYIATSPNLQGLVAEAQSKDRLIGAVYDCVDLLMEHELQHALRRRPLAAWSGDFVEPLPAQ